MRPEHFDSGEALVGHALVARTLRELGLTHVFSVPAVPIYDTVGACATEGLRVIGTRHQQAAALMAVSQNYMAGRQVATVLVSPGAAASNALTGALVARDNCWPLVVLAGAVAQGEEAHGQFMSLDAPALYRSITKGAAPIQSAAEIPSAIARAFRLAREGSPGPVLLELPADVLSGRAEFLLPPPAASTGAPEIPAATLDAAAHLLLAAKRPLLVIGKGTRWAEPFEQLAALVDRLSLPFITSPIARGFVSDAHPLCCNPIHWAAQRDADLVLVLGARLDWTFRYGMEINRAASLIHVDIDEQQIGANRPAQLRVHGDVGAFLHGLLERTPEVAAAGRLRAERGPWVEDLSRRRANATQARAVALASRETPIAPHTLAHAVANALPDDAISIFDGNLVMSACLTGIPARQPLSRLTPGSGGCLGGGIPFAIGAKLQCPERPVVAICGDFAFGLSAFELETAVRHDIPIVVIVANNDGNSGSLRQRSTFPAGHPDRVTMFEPGIQYQRIIEAFGGYGEHVQGASGIGPALRRAVASARPSCINVAIDPEAPFPRA